MYRIITDNYIIQCCSAQYCAISLLSIFTYSRTLIIRESFKAVTKDAELHDCDIVKRFVSLLWITGTGRWLITSVVCQIWLHGGSADVFTSTHGWISGLSSWDILCSYMRIWTSLNGLWNEIEIVWASICVVLLRFSWWVSVYVNDPRRSISALKSSWREFVSHAAEMMHWFHRHERWKTDTRF